MPETGVTYPPAQHVLRDLCLVTEIGSDLTGRASLHVPDALRTPQGFPHPGVLATAVDMLGGGLAAVAAHPNWIATADLTLHLLPRPVESVEITARVARHGRTTAVLEVDLTGDGAAMGIATMTFAILARRDSNPTVVVEGDRTPSTLALDGSGFSAPFETQTGLRRTGDGRAELPITDYVRNSLGALQGGLMAATATAAAEDTCAARLGPSTIADLQITYLALGRVGPIRATATVERQTGHRDAGVRVELVDVGAQQKPTTVVHARGIAT